MGACLPACLPACLQVDLKRANNCLIMLSKFSKLLSFADIAVRHARTHSGALPIACTRTECSVVSRDVHAERLYTPNLCIRTQLAHLYLSKLAL